MGVVNRTIYIPRANFLAGHSGSGIGGPGYVGPDASEATMAGTRGAIVVDDSINPPSSFLFKANSPKRTVGRRVDIYSSAAWGYSHFAEATLAALFPMAAGQILSLELFAEDFRLYVASLSGSSNFYIWCKA